LTQLRQEAKRRKGNDRRRVIASVSRLAAAIVITLLLTAFTIQGVGMALGYNLIEMFWNAINKPEETVLDVGGNEFLRTEDVRFYNSINELIEAENIDILHPAQLPEGYSFNDFEVWDLDGRFEIRATATEPHLDFRIEIGVNFQIENCDYEANDIKYS
jgi:hypothetical protein